MTTRNNIRLYLPNGTPSNFTLREFANKAGLVTIHPELLVACQRTRDALCTRYGEDVQLRITDGFRTQLDLETLAARLGWIDEGGTVSRNSQHLYGKAVDCKALITRTGKAVPMGVLADVCNFHFDFVKLYPTHVHADVRKAV